MISRAINTGRDFSLAMRAIKNAIGIAITAQITVTQIATNNVLMVTLKYARSVKTSIKFSKVNSLIILLVKVSIFQIEVINKAKSEPI